MLRALRRLGGARSWHQLRPTTTRRTNTQPRSISDRESGRPSLRLNLGTCLRQQRLGLLEPNGSQAVEQGTEERRGAPRPLQTGGHSLLTPGAPFSRWTARATLAAGRPLEPLSCPSLQLPKDSQRFRQVGAQPGWGVVCLCWSLSRRQGERHQSHRGAPVPKGASPTKPSYPRCPQTEGLLRTQGNLEQQRGEGTRRTQHRK